MTIEPSVDDPFIRTAELARMFGVKELTVREWLRLGKISGKKVNGRWVVQRSAAKELANRLYGSN